MKKKITILLLAFGLFMGLALPAQAWSGSGSTSGTIAWNPGGNVWCTGGDTLHLRSYTFDFLWFDSTGTTQFGITSNGINYYRSRTGEHDGVSWTWDTERTSGSYFRATYSNLWSGGVAVFSVFCAP